MPKATVSMEATRYDLKSLPGGFVMLKQLSFGQMLKRRDRAARYMQEQAQGNNVGRIQIDILNEVSRQFDFANCITDHNLEDDQGNKLDFSNTATLEVLDPRIAAEIETQIDSMNQEDFNQETFTSPSEKPLTKTSPESPVVAE